MVDRSYPINIARNVKAAVTNVLAVHAPNAESHVVLNQDLQSQVALDTTQRYLLVLFSKSTTSTPTMAPSDTRAIHFAILLIVDIGDSPDDYKGIAAQQNPDAMSEQRHVKHADADIQERMSNEVRSTKATTRYAVRNAVNFCAIETSAGSRLYNVVVSHNETAKDVLHEMAYVKQDEEPIDKLEVKSKKDLAPLIKGNTTRELIVDFELLRRNGDIYIHVDTRGADTAKPYEVSKAEHPARFADRRMTSQEMLNLRRQQIRSLRRTSPTEPTPRRRVWSHNKSTTKDVVYFAQFPPRILSLACKSANCQLFNVGARLAQSANAVKLNVTPDALPKYKAQFVAKERHVSLCVVLD